MILFKHKDFCSNLFITKYEYEPSWDQGQGQGQDQGPVL